MKRILFIAIALFAFGFSFAQAPQKMSYQAVIRNSSDVLVTNTAVGMRVSILQGSITGTPVYVEIYNPNPITNTNGLVTVEIGGGIPITGTFAGIDWSAGPYFIKSETDPTGGTSYSITGTSQLLSVPYAIQSQKTESIIGGETDPVFGAHAASGITSTLIGNWNTAYGWGNHASAGYLTSYTETDPLWTVSPSFGITNTNITNWSSAFGWGNHASAGYLTSFTETDPFFTSNFDFTGASSNDLLQFNGTKWVKFTPNYSLNSHTHANATTSASGFLSATDKTKLDGLQNANLTAGEGISITGSYPNLTVSQSEWVGSIYRWCIFSTYDQSCCWFANNSTALFGGVAPSSWTDGSAVASNLSSDKQTLLALFSNKTNGGKNALVCADSWYSYSSTNGKIAGALFRIKNTTGAAITWTVDWYCTAYGGWGESASVAVNGVNVWTSGANNYFANNHVTTAITIPANRTSTVIFLSSSSPTSGNMRSLFLGFDNNSLLLPAGLKYVDDLNTAPNGWND